MGELGNSAGKGNGELMKQMRDHQMGSWESVGAGRWLELGCQGLLRRAWLEWVWRKSRQQPHLGNPWAWAYCVVGQGEVATGIMALDS